MRRAPLHAILYRADPAGRNPAGPAAETFRFARRTPGVHDPRGANAGMRRAPLHAILHRADPAGMNPAGPAAETFRFARRGAARLRAPGITRSSSMGRARSLASRSNTPPMPATRMAPSSPYAQRSVGRASRARASYERRWSGERLPAPGTASSDPTIGPRFW